MFQSLRGVIVLLLLISNLYYHISNLKAFGLGVVLFRSISIYNKEVSGTQYDMRTTTNNLSRHFVPRGWDQIGSYRGCTYRFCY